MSSRSYCTYCESVFSSVNLVGGLRERGREREREGGEREGGREGGERMEFR